MKVSKATRDLFSFVAQFNKSVQITDGITSVMSTAGNALVTFPLSDVGATPLYIFDMAKFVKLLSFSINNTGTEVDVVANKQKIIIGNATAKSEMYQASQELFKDVPKTINMPSITATINLPVGLAKKVEQLIATDGANEVIKFSFCNNVVTVTSLSLTLEVADTISIQLPCESESEFEISFNAIDIKLLPNSDYVVYVSDKGIAKFEVAGVVSQFIAAKKG